MNENSETPSEQKVPVEHEPVKIKDPKLLKLQSENAKLKEDIPSGYIAVELSTHGKYGAPSLFHVRNFDTSDLINLALSDDADLPIKVSKMLNGLILEEGVRVDDFHEKEVIETLIAIYKTFYSGVMKDVAYRPDDADYEFLAKKCGGKETDAFRAQRRALETGEWKPRFDINLEKIDYYDTPDDVKTSARIVKRDGFAVRFSYPRYGDVVLLRDFIDRIYREEDKRFSSLNGVLKFRREQEDRITKGENVAYASLPTITDFDKKRVKEYETEKAIFTLNAVKALHLLEFDGKDVSKLSLEERIELAKDPRLDYSTFNEVSKFFETMKLGAKEEITVYNPIQERVMKRNFTFQLVDVLSAIRDTRPDGATISFE